MVSPVVRTREPKEQLIGVDETKYYAAFLA